MTVVKKRIIASVTTFILLQVIFACFGVNVFTCLPGFYLGYTVFITIAASVMAAFYPFQTVVEN